MMTSKLQLQLAQDAELQSLLEAAVERATAEQEPYTIVACVPQRLPGEEIGDVVQAGAKCAFNLVRDGDVVGLLNEEIVIVGLVGTTPNLARVFSFRLQGDLRLATSHLRNTVWETAYACLPDDGESCEELLHRAVEGAAQGRRRLI